METILRKVTRLLKKDFPPPDKVALQDEDGILGIVTSKRFKGLDAIDRIDLIWKPLEPHLNTDEKKRIVVIIGVTPEEEVAHTSY